MERVLKSLFTLVLAAAMCAAVSACNTNGGIPASPLPPGGGGGIVLPTPSAVPTATPSTKPSSSPTRSPSPTPSPTPT
jgi:hypothetical protein